MTLIFFDISVIP